MNLPTELLSLIVRYLSQSDLCACSLVNKRFYTLTNPLLWESPHIHGANNNNLFLATLRESPLSSHYIQSLRTTYLNDYTTLLRWVNHLPSQLTSLTIDNACKLTDDGLIPFLRHHAQLETLVLNRVSSSITLQSFKALGQHCPQLLHLTLGPYYNRSGNIFSALSPGCPRLKILDITFDHNTSDPASMYFALLHHDTLDDNDDLVEMDGGDAGRRDISRRHLHNQVLALAGLRDLEHLRLHWPPPRFGRLLTPRNGLKDRTGQTAWPHLTRLELHLFTCFHDHHAMALIRSHPRLQHLSLANTNHTKLTNTFLDAIPTWLSDLKTLHLMESYGITSQGLRRLVQRCPSLMHVSFPACYQIKNCDFPEATKECLDTNDNDGTGSQYRMNIFGDGDDDDDNDDSTLDATMHQLDQETINRIRLGIAPQ